MSEQEQPQQPQGIPWDEDTSLCERCEGERFEPCHIEPGFEFDDIPRLIISDHDWLEIETVISFAVTELQQKGSTYLAQKMRIVAMQLSHAKANAGD